MITTPRPSFQIRGRRATSVSGAGTPNFGGLPVADRQVPVIGTGDANMRALSRGGTTTDPHTGAVVQRITSAALSANSFQAEYASGPPISSLPWESAGVWYVTIAYHEANGGSWLEDVNLSTKALF